MSDNKRGIFLKVHSLIGFVSENLNSGGCWCQEKVGFFVDFQRSFCTVYIINFLTASATTNCYWLIETPRESTFV